MDLPRSRCSSTSGRKRLPWQVSQVVTMGSRWARSVSMTPSPLQCGHAPLELPENSAASTALALAKVLRTLSRIPV
jgi:hypothetical protein